MGKDTGAVGVEPESHDAYTKTRDKVTLKVILTGDLNVTLVGCSRKTGDTPISVE